MVGITLRITNVDRLLDGGPTSFSTADQRFEIGRDPFREWTLPDPQRHISGRHCEIVREGTNYILNDFSSNGTFVNGARQRVKSPYQLRNGDVLSVGDYIIAVQIAQHTDRPEESSWRDDHDDDIWGSGVSSPPTQDRSPFEPTGRGPASSDFVDSHLDLPRSRQISKERDDVFEGFAAPPTNTHQGSISAGAISNLDWPGNQKAPLRIQSASQEAAPATERWRGQSTSSERLMAAFCEGAGLPTGALSNRNAEDLFRELGALMVMITTQTSQLLRARASAKAMVRTSGRTMIGALDNNPLKFMPDAIEALQVMLGGGRAGYLGAEQSFQQSFADLKQHELATYAAMQKALSRLLADLSPEAVEAKVSATPFTSRKAKAWETFVSRWDAKTEASANGILDVFLSYFAEAYESVVSK